MVNAMHGSAVPNLAVAAALGRHETGNQLTTGLQNARDSDGGTLPKARVTKTAAPSNQPTHPWCCCQTSAQSRRPCGSRPTTGCSAPPLWTRSTSHPGGWSAGENIHVRCVENPTTGCSARRQLIHSTSPPGGKWEAWKSNKGRCRPRDKQLQRSPPCDHALHLACSQLRNQTCPLSPPAWCRGHP